MTLLHPSVQIQELYPIGTIIEATCPPNENWLRCEGQLLSRSAYSELLAAVETDNPYPWQFQNVGENLPSEFSGSAIVGMTNNGNRYVGVGWDGESAYTDDGVSWTRVAMPDLTKNYSDLAYNGSVFFAPAYNATAAATSTNGSSWTARTLPSAYDWESVCWDGTYFILVANDYNTCLRSTDGITWNTAGTFPSGASSQAGAHGVRSDGSGLIVAIQMGGGAVFVSEDSGSTWDWSHTLPKAPYATFSQQKMSYANGWFFVPTYYGRGFSYASQDGYEWKTIYHNQIEFLSSERYSNIGPMDMNPSVHRWYYFKDQWFAVPNGTEFGVRSPDMKRFYAWPINMAMVGSGTEAAGYITTSGKIFIVDAWGRYVTYAEEYGFDESTYFQLPRTMFNYKGRLGLYNYIRAK